MATKYKEYFKRMLESEKELFENFRNIHAKYQLDPNKWQGEYNKIGEKVLDVIREWENRLCHHSEGGKYAKFAGRLAEKFWSQIRKEFPLIDHVGVIIKEPAFSLKKIRMPL